MTKKQVIDLAKLHKRKVAWGGLVVFDLLALLAIYGQFFSRLPSKISSQSEKICSSFPVKNIVSDILRPRYWFLAISIVFLALMLVKLIIASEISLKVNRARYDWLLVLAPLTTFFITAFLITKLYCWS